MLYGVLHQRLEAQERDAHAEHLGRHLQGDPEPVAEPGLLEQQVALDRAQLLGQRRELAVLAEGVAGEVGELEQQLAGPVGVGAHERGDRAEGVVDEVRADLCAQRAHLGAHQPVPRLVELGELELAGDPAGHLLGRAEQAGRRLVGQARRARRRRGRRSPAGWRSRAGPGTPRCRRRGRRGPATTVALSLDGPRGEHVGLVGVVGGEPVVPEERGGCRRSPPPACRAGCAGASGCARPTPGSGPRAARARRARRCAACGRWPGRRRCRADGRTSGCAGPRMPSGVYLKSISCVPGSSGGGGFWAADDGVGPDRARLLRSPVGGGGSGGSSWWRTTAR